MTRNNEQRKDRDAIGAATAPPSATALERTQIARYHTKGGHGFAAEDANNLADRLRGKVAKLVGRSNERHGADRVVDGVHVQSKYYENAPATMRSAFDPRGGNYRYSGQVLEVPKDQYDECVALMRQRIREDRVPGHTDPADAEKLVKKGTVTYRQARNVARAGNIDSVTFDVKTGAVVASGAFGVSFAINYWQGRRQGLDNTGAIRAAFGEALATGSSTLVAHVVSTQLLRTKSAAWGTVVARPCVKTIAHTSLGKKAVEGIAAASLGKAVHGAAAVNHVSKLLRSNAVTGTVTAVVSCTPDFYRAAFDKSISWQQFTKNSVVNVAGVAGGVGGWMGGVAVGAAVGSAIPIVGTAVGGAVGGIMGALGLGIVTSQVTKSIADEFVEDDVEALVRVLEVELQKLALEYMFSEPEVERIAEMVRRKADAEWLRRMYRETGGDSAAGRRFVCETFEREFMEIAERRQKIAPPSAKRFRREVVNFVPSH